MNTGDIKLSIKQARKVLVVEKRVEGKMSNSDAAEALGLSVRQIQRIGKVFKIKGHAALIHGNTGRKPSHTLHQNIKELVLEKATLYSGTSINRVGGLPLIERPSFHTTSFAPTPGTLKSDVTG